MPIRDIFSQRYVRESLQQIDASASSALGALAIVHAILRTLAQALFRARIREYTLPDGAFPQRVEVINSQGPSFDMRAEVAAVLACDVAFRLRCLHFSRVLSRHNVVTRLSLKQETLIKTLQSY